MEDAEIPIPVKSAVVRFRERASARFGARLREVVLFGSYARGEAHEESDVDVLVVVDGLTEHERLELFRLASEVDSASEGGWVGLSVVAHSTAQATDMRARRRVLYSRIDREGVVA